MTSLHISQSKILLRCFPKIKNSVSYPNEYFIHIWKSGWGCFENDVAEPGESIQDTLFDGINFNC